MTFLVTGNHLYLGQVEVTSKRSGRSTMMEGWVGSPEEATHFPTRSAALADAAKYGSLVAVVEMPLAVSTGHLSGLAPAHGRRA